MSILLILFGLWLIPDETEFQMSVAAIETWSGWSFFGAIVAASGAFGLAKSALFAFRARGTSGEWHFQLTDESLLWSVPPHAHGKEEGFRVRLKELKSLEFRTLERESGGDLRQYWVHFHHKDSIELKGYSGVSLSWLVSQIAAAGVHYEETSERY